MILYGLAEPLDRIDLLLHFRCIHPDRHRVLTILREIDLVRLVGGHLDGNADQYILLVIVIRCNGKRYRAVFWDCAQRSMVYSIFLQCISACRQPQYSFPVIFRNSLIGIWRLAIAAGNLYIDISILDLRVFIQVIDCKLHAVQRIVVFVRRRAICQSTAAGRNEIHVCIGVCNFQCAGSTIGIGSTLRSAYATAVSANNSNTRIAMCIITPPVYITALLSLLRTLRTPIVRTTIFAIVSSVRLCTCSIAIIVTDLTTAKAIIAV